VSGIKRLSDTGKSFVILNPLKLAAKNERDYQMMEFRQYASRRLLVRDRSI
jgi:hypothetical protein